MKHVTNIISAGALFLMATPLTLTAQDTGMSFFVTSQGSGNGADLGGLEGADAHCISLAETAGVKGKT